MSAHSEASVCCRHLTQPHATSLPRAAAAAAAARAAAEAAAATEAAERAAREAAAARAAMKQQLRANSITYRLNLCGTAVAAPLQSTGSRQPQLSVKLSIWPDTGAGVVEPAPIAQLNQLYDSSDSATEGAAALAIQVAQQVYTHYVPAATEGIVDLEGLEVQRQGASSTQLQQQQEVDGQQLLQGGSSSSSGSSGVQLGEGDVVLWRLLLLGRLEAAGRQAVGQVAPLAASGELQQDLKVPQCLHPGGWGGGVVAGGREGPRPASNLAEGQIHP